MTSPSNDTAIRAGIPYRGRIAPTPTGHLHLGHAATFLTAYERAAKARGVTVLRIEDLDPHRCKRDYAEAVIEDLRWLGIEWQEGPYYQSQRREFYLEAWRRLRDGGFIYPCTRSRRDVAAPRCREWVSAYDFILREGRGARSGITNKGLIAGPCKTQLGGTA